MKTVLVYLIALFFPLCLNSPLLHGESMQTQTDPLPQHLYKILSLRNWLASQSRNTLVLSADDDLFIHLSKEDQLEKIIKKYWSQAPQFVVLKIDTTQLQGKLEYEANPGGTNRYFHLYEGFIPFDAIVESRTIYREPIDSCAASKLGIVQVGEPVLRTQARELSTEEILSPQIQNLIEMMKTTMRAAPGVGLAAPQIGEAIQLAVVEDMDQNHLTAEEIKERKRYPVPFHVLINPRIYPEENSAETLFFEGCLSVPEFVAAVPRAESIRVECLNEKAEPITIHATGWYARILQHEIDHLNAILYIDRAILSTLTTQDNYIKLWKKKTTQELENSR